MEMVRHVGFTGHNQTPSQRHDFITWTSSQRACFDDDSATETAYSSKAATIAKAVLQGKNKVGMR